MSGLLLLTVSVALTLAFGASLALALRVPDLAGVVVASLVGGAAQIVLITELLSLAGLWKPFLSVVCQLLTLAPFAWRFRPAIEPELVANAIAVRRRLTESNLLGVIVREPLALSVVVVCIALVGIELFVAIAVAPNTWDSMTYHLARIVYWMQNDSVLQYANASSRQATFPINAEVLQGWTMMLSNGDRFAQLIQWTAQLGIVAFVLAAGRDLGYRLRDRTLAACAFLAMPIAVGEASSTMNDMVQAFFAAAAMLFLVRALRGKREAAVIFALAAGLMFGTKSYGMLLAAALGVASLVLVGRDVRRLLRLALLAGAAVLAFGFFVYGENLARGNGFLGSDVGDVSRIHSVREIPANAVAVSWRWTMSVPEFVYGGGLSSLAGFVNDSLWRPLASWGGIEEPKPLLIFPMFTEDVVGGGLPLLLLIFPALVLGLARPRSRDELAYAVAALTGFLLIVATLMYNDWIGRFGLAEAALAAPLVSRLFRKKFFVGLLLVLAVITTATMGISSVTKSVYKSDGRALIGQSRIAQQSVFQPYQDPMIRAVEKLVPKGSRLGMASPGDGWEYMFAGPHFERTLVRLPEGQLPPDAFERYDLDALLITNPPLLGQKIFSPAARSDFQQLILHP